jgi:hypothetical protein
MFSQLRLIDPRDAPPLFVSELITMASKFSVRAILFFQQHGLSRLANLSPCLSTTSAYRADSRIRLRRAPDFGGIGIKIPLDRAHQISSP